MASAYAKFTGELGVCLATSGPGASHLVTGMYDARLDHMPVLAITGQQSRNAIGGHYQQEVDLVSMFKDVAGAFISSRRPRPRRYAISWTEPSALRSSNGRVTAIILPNDLQDEPYQQPRARKHGTVHSGVGFAKPRTTPFDADLRRAAVVLNAGDKVAILVGAGALGATDQVVAVAEKLRAGVAKALLGKAALPDDLPFVTGSIGGLRTKPSYKLMTECDTLLHGGLGLSLLRVPARGGKGAGCADRHRARDAVDPLSDGGQSRRRRQGDARGSPPASGSEVQRRLAQPGSRAMSRIRGKYSKIGPCSRPIPSIRNV